MIFTDYENAFDLVETVVVLHATLQQGIGKHYGRILEDTHTEGTAIIKLHTDDPHGKVPTKKELDREDRIT